VPLADPWPRVWLCQRAPESAETHSPQLQATAIGYVFRPPWLWCARSAASDFTPPFCPSASFPVTALRRVGSRSRRLCVGCAFGARGFLRSFSDGFFGDSRASFPALAAAMLGAAAAAADPVPAGPSQLPAAWLSVKAAAVPVPPRPPSAPLVVAAGGSSASVSPPGLRSLEKKGPLRVDRSGKSLPH
jgi:hypothetical protein